MSWSDLVYSNRLQYGHPPLHNACSRGHVEVVSLLLAASAALEARDQVLYEFVWLAEESV
jgi:ankyrin repeat protein